MASINKFNILVFAVLFTVCIMVCTGAPSNSTATNAKSPPPSHTRIQRSNRTSSATTTTKAPHGRSGVSGSNRTASVPSSSKTLSRQTRNAPAGNASTSFSTHDNHNSAPDTVSSNKQQGEVTKQTNVSTFRRQQHSSVNGTSISEPSSPVRPVPVRRVPARPQPSTSNSEEPGTFVVNSHIPVRPLSAQNRTTSPVRTESGVKGSSNAAFIHHEDADH